MANKKNAMDEAVQEALKSVERLDPKSGPGDVESQEDPEAEMSSEDDFDPDSIQVLQPGEGPPSADPNARSKAAPLEVELPEAEEEILIDQDEAAPAGGSAKDAILESMITAKNEAVEALAQTQKEANSFRERLMRVSAEFENFKKRQTRERQDAVKFANEGLLKELLPVLDNFERAMAGMRQPEEPDAAHQTLLEGVEMVFKQFQDALNRVGVEGFTAMGQPFDPAKHEAVSAREDPSVPNNTVVEEYQRGYMLNGRLVRPAMVIVSSGGASGPQKVAEGES